MKLSRTVVSSFMLFAISACSGWNSELDTLTIGKDNISQKPTCNFKVQQNCFTQSLSLLDDCFSESNGETEIFTEDLRFCSNEKGKLVEFLNPLKLANPGLDSPLSFKLYNGRKKCFHFSGTSTDFKVISDDYGTLEVNTLTGGDIQVNCFFGETFTIPADAAELGCRGQKSLPQNFLPQAQFTPLFALAGDEEEKSDGLAFDIKGSGQSVPVFSCFK